MDIANAALNNIESMKSHSGKPSPPNVSNPDMRALEEAEREIKRYFNELVHAWGETRQSEVSADANKMYI